MNDTHDHNHFHEVLPTLDELKHLRELLVKYEMMIMQNPPTTYNKEMVDMAREIQTDLEERIIKKLSVRK